jgi:pimeloyl-ACP methyl ester carboxylesterase
MSTFVLIHGAGDSSFYWHRVAPLLRDRGHEVVTVDLPADDPDAGLPEYVDTVLEAIGERDDLVVVGQSLGGFTAGQIPKHKSVRELVYLNAMIPAPGETAGEWWDNTAHPVEFGDDLVAIFLQLTPPEIVAEAYNHVTEETGAMGQPFPDDVPAVPTRVIHAQDDHCFPLDWFRPIAKERTGSEPVVIPGDHCVALSRPEDLVEALTA